MELFLHIGLHKTGTTTLQKEIFPKGEGYFYLGREYSSKLTKQIPFSEKIVISDETIIGRLYKSYNLTNSKTWIDQNLSNLDKISRIYPDCHIIMGVRKHTDWILSIYKHYIKYGGILNKKDFLSSLDENVKGLSYSDLNFTKRIEFINERFNKRPFIFDMYDIYNNRTKLLNNLSFYIVKNTSSFSALENHAFKKWNQGVDSRQADLIRYLNQTRFLRFSDNLDKRKLRSRFSKKLNLSSYKIATSLFLYSKDKKLSLTENEKKKINSIFEKDWISVKHYIDNQVFK